ncbi:hypothetical protein KKG19_04115 [Patescibacteria group bacterium]|nr:hypothetical protein [Patescibacteria group bacterium]
MSDLFTVAHIAQLHEIQKARLRRNQPGLGSEVEELIRRLTDGGVAGQKAARKKGARKSGQSDDLRVIQAKRFWDKGFGRELGYEKLENYLATIPEVPEHLKADDPDKPMLVLTEPRLQSIVKTCRLIGVVFNADDQTLEPYDERHATSQAPKWVRMHDGRRNHKRKPSTCRDELKNGEFSGTDLAGICCYLHFPDCAREDEHVMDLPGSVLAEYRDGCASLEVWDGRAGLCWRHDDVAISFCGAASCRE